MMNFSKLTLIATAIVTVMGIVPAASAQMDENYAGASGSLGKYSEVADYTQFDLNFDGRYRVGNQLSARASLTPTNQARFQATATYDFALGKKTGGYVGAGILSGLGTSPVFQLGAETKMNNNLVLYGMANYATSSSEVITKFGAGYSF
jgi:hypothetical protein